jgi:hypothetical protein
MPMADQHGVCSALALLKKLVGRNNGSWWQHAGVPRQPTIQMLFTPNTYGPKQGGGLVLAYYGHILNANTVL